MQYVQPLEVTTSGQQFFKLNESIDMLCSASPSPHLIATLLQVSKKIRHDIWDFLTDHNKPSLWLNEFCQGLWQYRDRPKEIFQYCNLHPIFIKQEAQDTYYIGKIICDKSKKENNVDVLVGGYYKYNDVDLYFPGWEIANHIKYDKLFNWYFVACAIALRIDRMIMFNALNRWKAGGIVPDDKYLYI